MESIFDIALAPAMTKLEWGHIQEGPLETGSQQLDVHAARNEVVGAQVLLRSDEEFVLTVDRTNWLHPLGFIPRVRLDVSFPQLPPDAVEVLPVGYLEGDDRRYWSEYLDRAGHTQVPPHRVQAVYVRIRLPKTIAAGEYLGFVSAYAQQGFADETPVWQGSLHLHVADVTLPDVADWSFHLDLWQHNTAIARQHRAPLWSDAHFALIDRYFASLAQLGQKVVSVIASEIPWSGQRCFRDRNYPSPLYEHAIIDVTRDADGHLHFDYTKMDRLLTMAAAHGMDREIEVFGLLNIWVDAPFGFGKVVADAPDAIRIRCYDQASGILTYLRQADELSQFIRALHDHLEDAGLLERVRIVADEPSDLATFNQRLAFVKEAAPGFRYKAAINHFEFMEEAPPEVIDYVPVLPLACQDPALTAERMQQLHARGGKMSWYVCCWPPIPNTFLHSPLTEGQLHGWLSFYLKLDGFLRWAFSLWPADPWQRASWRAPRWPAGDMFFVLPGPDGAPVETLRYEALRTAFQDYALLKMAERNLWAEDAQAAFEEAFGHILRTDAIEDFVAVGDRQHPPAPETLYSLAPEDYQRARQVILKALTT